MIGAIRIDGFKCFRDFELPIAPLTALTGFNAAGKSSALQPLLLMSQTLRRGLNTNKLLLNGPLAELGSTGDVLNRTLRSAPIGFGFTDGAEALSWTFVHDRSADRRELRLLQATFRDDAGERSWEGKLWLTDAPEAALVNTLRDAIVIGASRMGALEAYPHPSDPDLPRGDVGLRGEHAPYWYGELADDKVDAARRFPDDETETVRGQMDAWLSHLFPSAAVNADSIEGAALSHLRFRMGRGSGWLRPSNVGYGLSYAFPVLLALLTAPIGSIIVVDSPEAHLHPKAQSMMGKILARMAAAGLTVCVETHSDHLLSGMRIAVRDGLLDAKSVVVHFFGNAGEDGGNPAVSTLRMDAQGAISNWPEGFFDQAERDLAILSGWV